MRLSTRSNEQGVEWTTRGLQLPAALIKEQCNVTDLPQSMTLSYSVHEKWGHWGAWHTGENCSEVWTGGSWDPTAACSASSGNEACDLCGTRSGYQCKPSVFRPFADARGDFAYRFLNRHACELGRLSDMNGELEVELEEANTTNVTSVAVPDLRGESAGFAQMSIPFGEITAESVPAFKRLGFKGLFGKLAKPSGFRGLNCDASGPKAVHGNDCGCLEFNGERDESEGTLTNERPHDTFYLGGPKLDRLEGKSIVVSCGSSFGESAGKALMCAKLA